MRLVEPVNVSVGLITGGYEVGLLNSKFVGQVMEAGTQRRLEIATRGKDTSYRIGFFLKKYVIPQCFENLVSGRPKSDSNKDEASDAHHDERKCDRLCV